MMLIMLLSIWAICVWLLARLFPDVLFCTPVPPPTLGLMTGAVMLIGLPPPVAAVPGIMLTRWGASCCSTCRPCWIWNIACSTRGFVRVLRNSGRSNACRIWGIELRICSCSWGFAATGGEFAIAISVNWGFERNVSMIDCMRGSLKLPSKVCKFSALGNDDWVFAALGAMLAVSVVGTAAGAPPPDDHGFGRGSLFSVPCLAFVAANGHTIITNF